MNIQMAVLVIVCNNKFIVVFYFLMRFLKRLLGILPLQYAYAHCDIPCGIYDPTPLQIAAHTVVRMTQLLMDNEKVEEGAEKEHSLTRIVHVKEKQGATVEDELGTLENDYFKEDHYEKFPELQKLIKDAVKLSIKVRQTISMDDAIALREATLKIAEIFYKSKNVTPVRVKSLYPSEGEVVTYTV